MSKGVNRQWKLRSRPTGIVEESNFEFVEDAIPEPGEGEILVRTLWIGMDPAFRAWLNEESYAASVQIGDVVPGESGGDGSGRRVLRAGLCVKPSKFGLD